MTGTHDPSLTDYVRQHGGLETDAVVPLFLEVLSELSELHDRNLTHGFVQPNAIIIGPDQRARLEGPEVSESATDDLGFSDPEAFQYRAPEKLRGERVGPQIDVFSIGLALFNALTGEHACARIDGIDFDSWSGFLECLNSLEVRGEPIPCVFDSTLGVPNAVQDVVRKAVKLPPAERYADAREMHTALHTGWLGQPPPGDSHRAGIAWTSWPIVSAAGAAFVMLAAIAVYTLVISPDRDSKEIAALEATIRPLRLEVPAVLDRIRGERNKEDLGTPLREAAESIDAAQSSWLSAQANIADEDWSTALSNLRASLEGYDRACDHLGRAKVGQQAEISVASLSERSAYLRNVLIESKTKSLPIRSALDTLADLDAKIADLGSPTEDSACTSLLPSTARLDALTTARDALAAIEGDVSRLGSTIAKEAREAALSAEQRAKEDTLNDPIYTDQLVRARRWLGDGDQLFPKDPLEARQKFEQAQIGFDDALSTARAIRSRKRMLEQKRRALEKGATLRVAENLIDEANTHFEQHAWTEAESAYDRATKLLTSSLTESSERRKAELLQQEAIERQKLAEEAGAREATSDIFANAVRARKQGERALADSDFATAERNLQEAADTFRRLVEATNSKLQTARAEKKEIEDRLDQLLADRDCSDFDSWMTRQNCRAAVSSRDLGDEALEDRRLDSALEAYAQAHKAIESAAGSELASNTTASDTAGPPAQPLRGDPSTAVHRAPEIPEPKEIGDGSREADEAAATSVSEFVLPDAHESLAAIEPWQQEVYEALREYQGALESKDFARLERVWRFGHLDPLRGIWTSRFEKYAEVSIRLKLGLMRREADGRVVLDFDQTESLDGLGLTWAIHSTLERGSEGWQITQYHRSIKRSR